METVTKSQIMMLRAVTIPTPNVDLRKFVRITKYNVFETSTTMFAT